MKQSSSLAFVFPGQGSQRVGLLKEMAEKYPAILETFSQASASLGKDLWSLAQGSADILNETMNTQPVLLTASVALWQIWQSQSDLNPKLLAGHSLGEYSALVCAQSLSLTDAVKLVALRGKLMQDAVPAGVGAMAAVLGLEDETLRQICVEASENDIVAPANFNAIGQTVIAGSAIAVSRAATLAKAKGAKKIIMLPVSVPSHCALMKDAALKLTEHLANTKINSPKLPVIHNVDVDIHQHPDDIRQSLVQQLYLPVRWVETIQRLAKEGIQTTVECGPGKVLSGLIKRIDETIKTVMIEDPRELTLALETMS
ncbi:MAG: ACP S-malonyltransferase [Proteobacteria bacterium]|nr:ACP S-malonyltransferase [Pseudomonadota bacterium]